jgi:Flp pilus assembly protein TadB
MSGADVQRQIRTARGIRVAAFFVAALNAAFMLAVNVAGVSLLPSAVAAICCLALIVWQTRMLGTFRRQERDQRLEDGRWGQR